MTGNARAPLRSSARLSTGGGSSAAAAAAASEVRAAARSAEAAAAAARRRARALERAREVEDSPQELRDKCKRLAKALRNAKHLVVYTGAGISTAADIPDYRGPRGVWTRLRRGETVGRVEVCRAQPTLTHMALTALWARGTLKFVVSQNCDGLHVRAGLPRRALAELHGDMFAERCAACRRVYLRAFDTTERTARHAHATRRLCHRCGAELADTIVHFGERGRAAWPLNWAGALRHAAAADVVLCLGSSLKVLRRYPRLWRMQSAPHARPALYIVNLQWTPKDAVAALKINARCDDVMAQVARRLRLRVPRYSPRRDPLLAHAVPLAAPEQHTTRRPLLAAPPALCEQEDDSPSSSDSDDEVPLRHLAERMRAPPSPGPPATAPPPESCLTATPPLPEACPASWSPTPEPCPSSMLSLLAPRLPVTLPFSASRPPARRPFPASRPSVTTPPPAPGPLTTLPRPPPSPTPLARSPPTPPPRTRPPPPPRLPPPPDLLHAFQVNMRSGDATILLRAHHAPSVRPPAAPARPALAPAPPLVALAAPALQPRRPLSDLRMFRIARRAPPPPPAPPAPANGALVSARLRQLLRAPPPQPPQPPQPRPLRAPDHHANGHIESELDIKAECKFVYENDVGANPAPFFPTERISAYRVAESKPDVDSKPKREFDSEEKPDLFMKPKYEARVSNGAPSGSDSGSDSERSGAEASALAAAIIARAVLLCRAELYPGLHTILAPAAPRPARPARPAECAWCARHYGARRCQWYGAPPVDALAARVWRRARGRRYLCACCGERARPDERAPADDDGGGWYGKGYRKGRRRRR